MTVQERDGLGDRLVPDFLTHVEKGAFYGWPYSYIGQNPMPGFAQMRPDKVQAAVKPDFLFEAHSSLLDIVFYTGDQFPAEYRGDAFVALKGSWNRSEPTGYKVVRVPFKDGRPQGYYENFATGFWVSGVNRAEVWGRPTALAVAKDGALLVADDTGGTIWRIAYTGPKKQSGRRRRRAPAPRRSDRVVGWATAPERPRGQNRLARGCPRGQASQCDFAHPTAAVLTSCSSDRCWSSMRR